MKRRRLKYCDWYQLRGVVATGVREMLRLVVLLVLRIEHPMRRRLDKLVRCRFEDQSMVCFVIDFSVRSTGCPAFVFLNQRLVVQLREIVRYCSLQLVVVTVASDWICLAWFEISAAGFFASAGRLGLQIRYQILYLEYFQPFVPYLSNPRALFSREFSGEFPAFPVVVLLVRGTDLSLYYSEAMAWMIVAAGRAAIPHSHLPAGIVATMRRVVNYHSSWARQQQVELFDASGNPGSTAGRGFNPAGGAPGVTLAMSLFDLQDVCIAIGSIATLDSMVVDQIGIYGLKGPYCTLTTTDWFLQALSVIPRGSWGDVARRFTMIRWAAGSSPRPPEQPRKPEQQVGKQNKPAPEGHRGQTPVTATEDWEQLNQYPPAAATEDWEQLNQHPPAALNRGYATPHRTTSEKLQQSNISWLTKEPLAQYAMQMQ
ncbi:acyl-CoA dehydrogenase-related protein [Dorcoceras hygrometricum]|uniref:Acyl-CoA dehydrogenase-related protein n=1 Tax=Dorcoceras hygrometricum TaxID=472368 RepID=A0A2Z7C8Q1_9LAMI|nr:acyl-CoA dehydrogenase-related protein [Dorcoceras hygrometricum]